MNKYDILNQISAIKNDLEAKYGVTKIGLFGSYARDEQTSMSDIDIAVEMSSSKKNIHTFFNLRRDLENAFGTKVDLGIESSLKAIAKEYILKEIIYV